MIWKSKRFNYVSKWLEIEEIDIRIDGQLDDSAKIINEKSKEIARI